MNHRPFLLSRSFPYTRLEYLENVGWSRVFLPIYPQAGDVVEVESELRFTVLSERQAELSNVDPRLHWGTYDESTFYCGIGHSYTSNCGAADTDWHVFRIVSGGEDAGFWLDGVRTYTARPATGVFASTGLQLWCNLNSNRRCLNCKKWLRILINGKQVMHLIPVLDAAGRPALFDLVTHVFFYNVGADELVAGPLMLPGGYRRVQYVESQGKQYCRIPVSVDGSNECAFSSEVDIQFFGSTRQLMGFSTNACCYWGANADRSAYELGGGYELPALCCERNVVTYTRKGKNAALNIKDKYVSRTTADTPGVFASYGLFIPAYQHVITPVCEARLYEAKLYENGVLTRHLLPVMDSLDMCCLYDAVSRSCFYSEGEEPFTAGPFIYS